MEKTNSIGLNMQQMWNLVSGKGDDWGIKGYEVPKYYHDPIRMKENKENFDIAVNKKKPPKPKKIDLKKKRGDFLEEIIKKTEKEPGPWQYNVKIDWVKGEKIIDENKDQQKFRQKWQGVPKENLQIINPQKKGQKKLDMKIKKHTYIDQIIAQNSKKNYPKPGPTDHFFDDQGIKRYQSNHKELYSKKMPSEQKKTNLPKEKKNFYFSWSQKYGAQIPAPGYTNPDMKTQKPMEETKITYKKFKDLEKQKMNYEKQKKLRDKERLNNLKDKVKFDINKLDKPIPQDINTFDYIAQEKQKISIKKKPLGFGVGNRFDKDERTKWEERVKIYNKNSQKPMSLKSDPQPGPQHYSLISHWPGKQNKKEKNEKKGINYLSKVSKEKFN